MAKKFIAFRASEIEEKFLNGEAKRTNANVTTVIKQLIQATIEGKEREDQIEVLEAKLERLEEISLRVAESATFAKHMTLANCNILIHEDEEKMDEIRKVCDELTKEDMEEFKNE